MKTYVVCVSDSAGVDRRTPVLVQEDTSLGRVAQMAIDEFISIEGDDIDFPLFVDIHSAEEFAGVRWLHPSPTSHV